MKNLILICGLIFVSQSLNAASVCEYVFREIDKRHQQAFKAEDPNYDPLDPKTWYPDIEPLHLHKNVGKGAISSFPKIPTDPKRAKEAAKIKAAATDRGLFQWWHALVLVKDRAEAEALIDKDVFFMKTDPLLNQLILVTGLNFEQRAALLPKEGDSWAQIRAKEQQLVDIWDTIYTNPEGIPGMSALQYKGSDGQWRWVPLADVKRFQFTESVYQDRVVNNGKLHYFNQVMWVRTPQRGTVEMDSVFAYRKYTMQPIEAESQKLSEISGITQKMLKMVYRQSFSGLSEAELIQKIELLASYGVNFPGEVAGAFKKYNNQFKKPAFKEQNPFFDFLMSEIAAAAPAKGRDKAEVRDVAIRLIRDEIVPKLRHNTEIEKTLVYDADLNQLRQLAGLDKKSLTMFYKQSILKAESEEQANALVDELVAYAVEHKGELLQAYKDYTKEVDDKSRIDIPFIRFVRSRFGQVNISIVETSNPNYNPALNLLNNVILPKMTQNLVVESSKNRVNALKNKLKAVFKAIEDLGGLKYDRRVLRGINKDRTPQVDVIPSVLRSVHFTFNTPAIVAGGREITESGVASVIKASMVQERVGQQENAGFERFSLDDIKMYEHLIAEGKGYSIEMRDQDGNIIGGGFGTIGKSMFEGESVSHPVIKMQVTKEGVLKEERIGILFAQAFKFVLFDLFDSAGLVMQDSSQVSPFTRTIGGSYKLMEVYLNRMAELRKQTQVGFEDVRWPEKIELEPFMEEVLP